MVDGCSALYENKVRPQAPQAYLATLSCPFWTKDSKTQSAPHQRAVNLQN